MAEESLKNKTIKSVGWSAADAFLGQGVTFLVGLVLARLLTPAEYGLIGVCLIFTTVLAGIVDSGFSNAIIRKKKVSDDDYNTMFITNMIISLALYLLLFLSSPLIAVFFDREELIPLIRAMGVMLIFQALSITQVTVLTKKLDFKTKTKASLISAIVSGIIGVVMAFIGFGVWSLVGQKLSQTLLYSIILWILNKWRPCFKFNKNSFSYMWSFGSKLMLSGILNNIWNQLYQVVVGKYYSPSTLGQYSRSKEYANIFSSNITAIVQRVSYPALAEIQDNKKRMIEAYRRVIKVTMFISSISMIFIGAIADPLIYCFIGPQWREAASYLPFICITMSTYPIHAINLNMLQIQGRSDLFLKLEIIKKIYGVIPLVIGVFDIYMMLIALIITCIISFFLNSYYTGKYLGYTSFDQLRDILPSYGIAFIIALSVFFFKYIPISYWIILPIQVITGIIIGYFICEFCKLPEYKEIKEIFIVAIKKKGIVSFFNTLN